MSEIPRLEDYSTCSMRWIEMFFDSVEDKGDYFEFYVKGTSIGTASKKPLSRKTIVKLKSFSEWEY